MRKIGFCNYLYLLPCITETSCGKGVLFCLKQAAPGHPNLKHGTKKKLPKANKAQVANWIYDEYLSMQVKRGEQ